MSLRISATTSACGIPPVRSILSERRLSSSAWARVSVKGLSLMIAPLSALRPTWPYAEDSLCCENSRLVRGPLSRPSFGRPTSPRFAGRGADEESAHVAEDARDDVAGLVDVDAQEDLDARQGLVGAA